MHNHIATNLDCVVLLDIDGTLLAGPQSGPSAGFLAMGQATKKMLGSVGAYNAVEFAGRTDEQIARSMLETAGEKSPPYSRVADAVACYLEFLAQNIEKVPYTILGHPREATNALRERGAVVELGTGNVSAGAKIKLANAGIDDLFDFEKGGFGDRAETRADLLRAGASRCDPTGKRPVVIVGDTPHDVTAAKEIGALCVGIPYRQNDADTLLKAGADAINEQVDTSLAETIEALLAQCE